LYKNANIRVRPKMIKRFIYSKLPKPIAKEVLLFVNTPAQARMFCNGFASCPSGLLCNTISDLVQNPYLWVPSENAILQQKWLEEVYPKNIAYKSPKIKSVIKCIKCKQNSVEYYEKQIRGADEPMTCFCQCTVPGCGKRWTL
jgi:DNA-directed RNA polymerase subunit M/transcription elongation factor TFIIS